MGSHRQKGKKEDVFIVFNYSKVFGKNVSKYRMHITKMNYLNGIHF
jgi:hypothetical protein